MNNYVQIKWAENVPTISMDLVLVGCNLCGAHWSFCARSSVLLELSKKKKQVVNIEVIRLYGTSIDRNMLVMSQ